MKRTAKSNVAIWRPFPSPDPERNLRPMSVIIADTVEKSAKVADVASSATKRKAKTKIHRAA